MITNDVTGIEKAGQATSVVSIRKTYEGSLPFIGDSNATVSLVPEPNGSGWIGVQCIHSELVRSPHLTGSHIESARHVFGDGMAVKEVLLNYKTPLNALHVQLEAQQIAIDQIESLGQVITFRFASGDTYQLVHKETFTDFPTDYVITRAQLQEAIGDLKEKVVLICLTGHEQTIHNWPYLTNDAVDLLVEKGVEIIGLNIPSFDRETDGGLTSNHKRFFADQTHLIVESLALEKAPCGRVALTLNPEPGYDGCSDTIPCEPTLN